MKPVSVIGLLRSCGSSLILSARHCWAVYWSGRRHWCWCRWICKLDDKQKVSHQET